MLLDESYPAEVRRGLPRLIIARLTSTTLYRFTPPLLATVAAGFHISLSRIGFAVTISELAGLSAPLFGRLAERWPRRRTMLCGLAGLAIGAAAAALATGLVSFGLALVVVALSKNFFDIGTNSWISDHVAYARRARVVGLAEMSWSGGLLIGVPILLGVVVVSNWRGGYAVGAVMVVVAALVLIAPLPRQRPGPNRPFATGDPHDTGALADGAVRTIVSFGLLMAASQCAFVTFGSWLRDRFGFTDGALAGVAFILGLGELAATLSTSRFTDRWGKRRSVRRGAGLMVPTAVLLAVGLSNHLGTGVTLLALFFLGFEFAIVSSISMATNLIPAKPSAGIGLAIGAGTLGRAVAVVPATRLYEASGFRGSMFLAASCAIACVFLLGRRSFT
jgi:MFS transporter, DHA1 family, inner membrane transport protein